MKKSFVTIALSVALCFTSYSAFAQKWVGTWTTAQQLVEPHNLAPEPGLSGNSIREIVQVSVGGEKIRVKFSNEHGKSPLNIKAVEIAIAQSSGSSADVKAGTSKSLKFKGKAGVDQIRGISLVRILNAGRWLLLMQLTINWGIERMWQSPFTMESVTTRL